MPLRAIVVDDEEDMRVLATVFLEMEGDFQVTSVSSGSDAVNVARLNGADVILLDYMMPEMDGPQTLAALRRDAQTQQIPVIFLTAKADAQTERDLLAAGASGVIQKPFSPDRLSADVRRILAVQK